MVGGMIPLPTTMALMMASTAPAAPSMWPVADLVELTLMSLSVSPKTALIARVSLKSLAGVDVLNILWLEPGILEGALHGALCPLAIRGWCGEMVSVACRAIANNLRVDLCSALESVFQLLENQDARTFAHDEPIT